MALPAGDPPKSTAIIVSGSQGLVPPTAQLSKAKARPAPSPGAAKLAKSKAVPKTPPPVIDGDNNCEIANDSAGHDEIGQLQDYASNNVGSDGKEGFAKDVTDDLFCEEPLPLEDDHADEDPMCCICRDFMNPKDEVWGCEE